MSMIMNENNQMSIESKSSCDYYRKLFTLLFILKIKLNFILLKSLNKREKQVS